MSLSESLLPEFDQEMENTRKLLQCVPDDRPEYRPHHKSMPLARLASHVAELPTWGVHTITLERLDLQPPGGAPLVPYRMSSTADLVLTFDRNAKACREAIASATDEHLAKMWTLTFGGKTLFTLPRATVLRRVVLNHLIHHRAQLGVYLRLNDVAIPGMYGASADEPGF
jgi:uncharacterized damage-inducible protein DinB